MNGHSSVRLLFLGKRKEDILCVYPLFFCLYSVILEGYHSSLMFPRLSLLIRKTYASNRSKSYKTKKEEIILDFFLLLVVPKRFELLQAVPETDVLPLHHGTISIICHPCGFDTAKVALNF